MDKKIHWLHGEHITELPDRHPIGVAVFDDETPDHDTLYHIYGGKIVEMFSEINPVMGAVGRYALTGRPDFSPVRDVCRLNRGHWNEVMAAWAKDRGPLIDLRKDGGWPLPVYVALKLTILAADVVEVREAFDYRIRILREIHSGTEAEKEIEVLTKYRDQLV